MTTNKQIIEDLHNVGNFIAGLQIDGKICKEARVLLNNFISENLIRLQNPPKKYDIRFNTKHNNETDLVWRVFENGKEHLVKGLDIRVPVSDSQSYEYGEIKYNIYCEGYMEIDDDDVAIIFANYED